MHKKINVIYHHPLPLNKNSTSASGIRPIQMLEAFKALGCDVDLVTGYASERRECIHNIKNKIKEGMVYDFVYSESSTMPTILTEPNHIPLHPFLDWHFFRYCNKKNIPIGLFYRDIYWLFDNYGRDLNPLKKHFAKLAYRFDLWVYGKTLSKLYLPSVAMGEYIPEVNSSIFSALPPGHMSPNINIKDMCSEHDKKLKIFYVGGMSEHYQMHKLFEAVRDVPGVELLVCTRDREWEKVKHEYPALTPNIHVVHLSGKSMEDELRSSDIALLLVKPHEYRDFASPVKLYEYLGFQKPIIATEGTLAGQFVNDNGIGWTVPYDTAEIKQLITKLSEGNLSIQSVINNLKSVASKHSWQSRAMQVIKDFVI